MSRKTHFESYYGHCPKCKSEDLKDAGESRFGKQILQCMNCSDIFLEDDAVWEDNENEKE